jgi:hypothetical protein
LIKEYRNEEEEFEGYFDELFHVAVFGIGIAKLVPKVLKIK